MKEKLRLIIDKYLEKFPEERERLSRLLDYLSHSIDDDITDWNNTNGHLTAGAFVYCKSENQFLVLYHKDLKMYLYPGGHATKEDESLLKTAKRELKEETGLENLELVSIFDKLVPFDIDTHLIPDNKKINMPKHYHFDFRYLFCVDKISNINFDKDEFKDYKWISLQELSKDKNYGSVVNKLNKVLEIRSRDDEK